MGIMLMKRGQLEDNLDLNLLHLSGRSAPLEVESLAGLAELVTSSTSSSQPAPPPVQQSYSKFLAHRRTALSEGNEETNSPDGARPSSSLELPDRKTSQNVPRKMSRAKHIMRAAVSLVSHAKEVAPAATSEKRPELLSTGTQLRVGPSGQCSIILFY